MPPSPAPARATTHANTALAKYRGKADITHNLPAVPSISLTLEELVTETTVCFNPGQEPDLTRLSALARRSSASAARSVFGGFVELSAGTPGENELAARPIAPCSHWDLRLVLAITAAGRKTVGSTEAMERSRTKSPFYEACIESAPRWCEIVKQAIQENDLQALGTAMEQSTLGFHCCAITAQPSTLYWSPATIAALQTVKKLRATGVPVWSRMDAGPQVKALCEAGDVARVCGALTQTPGVLRVLVATPGPGVEVGS